MSTQKLSLYDYEAIESFDPLKKEGQITKPELKPNTQIQVNQDGNDACEGDADGFGGTYSMNEVIVYGKA